MLLGKRILTSVGRRTNEYEELYPLHPPKKNSTVKHIYLSLSEAGFLSHGVRETYTAAPRVKGGEATGTRQRWMCNSIRRWLRFEFEISFSPPTADL